MPRVPAAALAALLVSPMASPPVATAQPVATATARTIRARCTVPAAARINVVTADSADALRRLAGTYQFVVQRTQPVDARARTTSTLVLAETDSSERFFHPLGQTDRQREQPLTGVVRSSNGLTSTLRLRGTALVTDHGSACRHCGTTIHRIEGHWNGGFAGTWNAILDGMQLIGEDGRRYSEMSGWFCAFTLPAPRPRPASRTTAPRKPAR